MSRPLNPRSPTFRADRLVRIGRIMARKSRAERFAGGEHLDGGRIGDVIDDLPEPN